MLTLRVIFVLVLLSTSVVSTSRHLCGRQLFEVMSAICEDCSVIHAKNHHLRDNTTYRKKRETLVKDCCRHHCSTEYLKNFCCW